VIESWWIIAMIYVAGIVLVGFIGTFFCYDDYDAALAALIWPVPVCVVILYLLAIVPRRIFDKLRGRA